VCSSQTASAETDFSKLQCVRHVTWALVLARFGTDLYDSVQFCGLCGRRGAHRVQAFRDTSGRLPVPGGVVCRDLVVCARFACSENKRFSLRLSPPGFPPGLKITSPIPGYHVTGQGRACSDLQTHVPKGDIAGVRRLVRAINTPGKSGDFSPRQNRPKCPNGHSRGGWFWWPTRARRGPGSEDIPLWYPLARSSKG
jgi:hypothetical protein